MCLVSTTKTPKIAKEDIEVYKLLSVKNGKLYSPWQLMKYELGTVYTDDSKVDPNLWNNFWIVEKGYYHSCVSALDAKLRLKSLPKKFISKYNIKIFKGIIPKDSEYYIGLRQDYASSSIKIIEEYYE